MNHIPEQYAKCAKMVQHFMTLTDEQWGRLGEGFHWPTHVVLHATAACQLDCIHCTYKHRDKTQKLPVTALARLVDDCAARGTVAMEHSGGEPTLYPQFEELAQLIHQRGMDQGLLTNGLRLPTLSDKTLESLTWIRVSLDAYGVGTPVPDLAVPEQVYVSASYIWNEETTDAMFEQAMAWCERNGCECRVVPDVRLPLTSPERRDAAKAVARYELASLVDRDVERRPPAACLTPWFKPMVAWDGWVYPCCYGTTYDWRRDVQKQYRVCRIDEFVTYFEDTPIHDLGHRCTNCLGWEENNIVAAATTPIQHGRFL